MLIVLHLIKSNGCVPLLNTLHKNLTKPQSISMSCHELDLVHLILNADIKLSLMRKTSGNVFLGHLGERVFNIFQMLHSIMIYGLGNVGLHVSFLFTQHKTAKG